MAGIRQKANFEKQNLHPLQSINKLSSCYEALTTPNAICDRYGNTQNSCGELFACYRSMSWAKTGLLACRAVASPELPAGDDTHASPYSLFPLRKVTSAWSLSKKALDAFHILVVELRY